MTIELGLPRPLGASVSRHGVNFAVYSSHATRIELVTFDARGAQDARYELPGRTGDVWHGLLPPGRAPAGTTYAYRVDGARDPARGLKFDPTIDLIDPYARSLGESPAHRAEVVDGAFDWRGDRPPARPWRDTIIYELHVKGFTQLHPAVPAEWRGKYLGLTTAAVLEHLTSLGVTAIELLPCQAFATEPFLLERGLTNYWGYNPVAWFAPAREYALEDPVIEFKSMVRALHAAGLEVILHVVFNHTAEGNEAGPVLSLKGLDNPVYYRLRHDPRYYENLTGCGNTIQCAHPQVRALIVDCLKYWVEEMHVDGFRFDLATVLGREAHGFNEHAALFKAIKADSSLAYTKLIAEPWDVGVDGYQLGRFPPGWAEWNDRYRDAVRGFWRRDAGTLGAFAERMAGSSDIFRYRGRKPTAGINYVTAHDGFTLEDLVSYNERHNEANLENNADGHPHNLSWNCGVEGPTEDPSVLRLRRQQRRNFLATLLLSQGVPMIQGGDEMGRTQRGNNNAYCQDNEISWLDWRLAERNTDLIGFVRLLTQLRREYPEFRRETFLKGTTSRGGVKDVTWLHPNGREMSAQDWQEQALHTLGVWYGKRGAAGRLLLLLNASAVDQSFALPAAPPAHGWMLRFDTSLEGASPARLGEGAYLLAASSAVLLEC
ncbi:MAG TPA: glycogen debranching protein GlgX [Steroidobacteraceae bacterium]|nr:glycogen debranching protein GlgX [Steroidobacteraceae bacterium]